MKYIPYGFYKVDILSIDSLHHNIHQWIEIKREI